MYSQQTGSALLIIVITITYCNSAEFRYDEIFSEIRDCYTGEKLYPFCSAVDESPINIKTHSSIEKEDICEEKLEWQYEESEGWKVIKKEHTIEIEAHQHKVAKFDNPVKESPDGRDIDLVDTFCLEQVHFHWDDESEHLGSEHAMNGKKFPVEAHFVHYNCEAGSVSGVQAKYPTFEAIEAAKKKGIDTHELGVIGVWFEISDEPNPTMEIIISAAEKLKCVDAPESGQDFPCEYRVCDEGESELDAQNRTKCVKSSTEPSDDTVQGIDLRDILSDDILDDTYFTYEGSLTTPPCTDDVRWFNMKKRANIGRAQWERLKKITKPCKDELIAPNWRPLQNNPNPVFRCTDEEDEELTNGSDPDGSSDSHDDDGDDDNTADDGDDDDDDDDEEEEDEETSDNATDDDDDDDSDDEDEGNEEEEEDDDDDDEGEDEEEEEEDDECEGLKKSECNDEEDDDGDSKCGFNVERGECYSIVRRAGVNGAGSFDDGFNAAKDLNEALPQNLYTLIGILCGIIGALIIIISGGGYYCYQKQAKQDALKTVEMVEEQSNHFTQR